MHHCFFPALNIISSLKEPKDHHLKLKDLGISESEDKINQSNMISGSSSHHGLGFCLLSHCPHFANFATTAFRRTSFTSKKFPIDREKNDLFSEFEAVVVFQEPAVGRVSQLVGMLMKVLFRCFCW